MREKFDFQRFLLMLRIARGTLRLKAIVVLAIAMALVFAFFDRSSGAKNSANTIFFVFMLMRSNDCFSHFVGRGRLTYYLLIPATRLEKFGALLTSLFFDPIVIYLIVISVQRLLILITPGYFTTIGSIDPGVFWVYILFFSFSSLMFIRMNGRLLPNLRVMTMLYIALFGGTFIGIIFLFKQMGIMPYLKENGIYLLMLLSIGAIGMSYRLFQKMEVKAFTATKD